MISKNGIVLYATSFAILLTMMTYVLPEYDKLWLSLEIIILPLAYATGYECLMNRQRNKFETIMNMMAEKTKIILNKVKLLENENISLKARRLQSLRHKA